MIQENTSDIKKYGIWQKKKQSKLHSLTHAVAVGFESFAAASQSNIIGNVQSEPLDNAQCVQEVQVLYYLGHGRLFAKARQCHPMLGNINGINQGNKSLQGDTL